MTDLAAPTASPAPAPAAVTPVARLASVVFGHARVAMLVVSVDGVVVDANAAAAELFGRPRYELTQEPLARHVALLSGRPLDGCLRGVASASDAVSLGPCSVSRRGLDAVQMELVVSSGCPATGRELLLVQLVVVGPAAGA